MAPRPELGVPAVPVTTEALGAHGDSQEHLRRRVAVNLSLSLCAVLFSTIFEEHIDLKRRMGEYMQQRNYHRSIRGEDHEESIDIIESPPQADMDLYDYSGPRAHLANTVSLPRRSTFTIPQCEEPRWRPEHPTATRRAGAYPTYDHPHTRAEGSSTPGPADGALDHTGELLAKLLSGSEIRT